MEHRHGNRSLWVSQPNAGFALNLDFWQILSLFDFRLQKYLHLLSLCRIFCDCSLTISVSLAHRSKKEWEIVSPTGRCPAEFNAKTPGCKAAKWAKQILNAKLRVLAITKW